jgi:hypothetical protein
MAAGLGPQAPLEPELEQLLGPEVPGSGLEPALGQELPGAAWRRRGSSTRTALPLT